MLNPQVPLAAMIGAIAGSFLATVVIRLEMDEPIWRGRSRCDGCGAPIPAAANVPILSYALLRGRCGRCGGAIDPLHPLLEAGCLLLGAASVAARPDAEGWAGASFGWILAALAATDIRAFRLPDVLVYPLFALGIASGATGLPPVLAERMWGAAAGFLALALVAAAYRAVRGREGLGRGDAKLLAAIGAWLGWRPLPWMVCAAAVAGLAWTAGIVLRGRRVSAVDRLPLGALLALSAWPAWLSGPW